MNGQLIFWVSSGAVIGGMMGNRLFDYLLTVFVSSNQVQLIQILLTILTLVFAFIYSFGNWRSYTFESFFWYLFCGFLLGFLASLLGIGGGPINVSLLMLLFSMTIKAATMYSICIIFFSQLAKLMTIFMTTGIQQYDLSTLVFIIPAAVLGGIIGSKLSNWLSSNNVKIVFQAAILLVIGLNVYNGWQLCQM